MDSNRWAFFLAFFGLAVTFVPVGPKLLRIALGTLSYGVAYFILIPAVLGGVPAAIVFVGMIAIAVWVWVFRRVRFTPASAPAPTRSLRRAALDLREEARSIRELAAGQPPAQQITARYEAFASLFREMDELIDDDPRCTQIAIKARKSLTLVRSASDDTNATVLHALGELIYAIDAALPDLGNPYRPSSSEGMADQGP